MGLMQKMFGGVAASPARTPRSRPAASAARPEGHSLPPAADMRRELLRLALRQSLTRNGIPTTWVAAQAHDVPGHDGPAGVHVRLVLQHWEPRLLPYTRAFEQDFEQRLLAVEPQAHTWLRGFSWQYERANGKPGSMPDPATWASAAVPIDGGPLVQVEPPPTGPQRKSKEELALLFAQQDRSRSTHDEPDFAPTQPATW